MLYIYEDSELKSNDNSFSSPIVFNPNGDFGDVIEKKLIIRNDDSNKYYTSVTIQSTPSELTSRGNPSYPNAPFKVKIKIQETQPTKSEWDLIEAGANSTTFSIGTSVLADTNDHGFWVRLETPANLRVGEIRSIKLRLNYTEN